ncbi:hypothetical protein [Streptomyces sp. NPDC052042]|uniref:hypothetical protein n=1 Tax=Streptomyces sp. NPDC052042 TaxID=3365683 RepID=UPI0037D7CA52
MSSVKIATAQFAPHYNETMRRLARLRITYTTAATSTVAKATSTTGHTRAHTAAAAARTRSAGQWTVQAPNARTADRLQRCAGRM